MRQEVNGLPKCFCSSALGFLVKTDGWRRLGYAKENVVTLCSVRQRVSSKESNHGLTNRKEKW